MKGLQNFGNTCYFNSVIQCILHVPKISNFLITMPYAGPSEFILEYKNLVKNFWLDKQKKVEDHSKILQLFQKKFPQFNNSQQHDCQETLFCLLEIFEKEFEQDILKTFYFKLIQETICPNEKTKSFENTNIVMLQPQKHEQTISELIKSNQSWNTLEGFTDTSGITHHVAATRTTFWSLPEILILSVKMYGEKIKTTLEDEIILQDRDNNLKYQLFATCTHLGSERGGHYIAYTKHKGIWYLKDDISCTKVESIKLTDFHYIIMYKRVCE